MGATFFMYIKIDITIKVIMLANNMMKLPSNTNEMNISHWAKVPEGNLHGNFDGFFNSKRFDKKQHAKTFQIDIIQFSKAYT